EAARQSGGDAARALRRLDQDGPRTAEGIEQWPCRVPPGEGEQARREVLLERGLALVVAPAPAPLEQRLARQVEVEARLPLVQVREYAYVGLPGVDRGSLARALAEEVDDGVLDAQRGEVQAAQRRAAPRDVHPQRLARIEPGAPVDRAGDPVELVLVAVRGVGKTQQDARGDARPQVRPVGEAEVALERYAATGGRRGCAERAQFEREGFLQPVRAGGMEREEGARREPQRPVSGQARDPAGR